jgi:hypothetical protein
MIEPYGTCSPTASRPRSLALLAVGSACRGRSLITLGVTLAFGIISVGRQRAQAEPMPLLPSLGGATRLLVDD